MGPKKAAAKKGGSGNPENGGEMVGLRYTIDYFTANHIMLFFLLLQDPETKAKMYMLTCQSLQVQLGKSGDILFVVKENLFCDDVR